MERRVAPVERRAAPAERRVAPVERRAAPAERRAALMPAVLMPAVPMPVAPMPETAAPMLRATPESANSVNRSELTPAFRPEPATPQPGRWIAGAKHEQGRARW